jgi:hypothetical protein
LLNRGVFWDKPAIWQIALHRIISADLLIRDYATIEQVVILSNLESLNAIFIQQELPPSTRLQQLNAIAITQMTSLLKNASIKKLK